ncbi:lytic transglycosylase domain-containing protein [Sabulicella glaciei]|uniref:Lytic transglycosylase domain-containing protein n=1 Tax=Sabulicella glaciei TaxID=2984948 RepID=A0ABT3NZQ1_9PROT|nr:lytic transglycosylase domain-containing protein [Roseococcus sp. MDT2-1-1]MCW8087641.1 lytic transglycosylase domain-containing protein [Roseococcus sp. MDT2-1-1]
MTALDAARMRRAFEAQGRGDFAAASREAERLEDRRLMGHLLADRLLRGQGGAAELQAWLSDFSDLPDAPAIHDTLLAKLPRGASAPPPPQQPELPGLAEMPEERSNGPESFTRNPALDRTVAARAAEGKVDAILSHLARTRGLTPAYAAQLKAEAAQVLFRQGKDEQALRLAQDALRNIPGHALAAFQVGLSAWALERWDLAYSSFERAARADSAAAALRASAAYWTARSAVRARRPTQYVPWMLQAAQEPRTFYGMIARRTLGLPPGLVWERDVAGETHAAAIAETDGGWRALALLQVGQTERAEAELRLLHRRARNNRLVVQGILSVAHQAGMASVATAVANAAQGEDARGRDTSRFPLPTLLPANGFRMDPSLIYAIALQESRFDPSAVSPAGARGLLQIMPATASYVANDPTLRGERVNRLHEPGFSLEIGQRYIHYLARHEATGGDLIRILAAYNAGPGNLQRWLPAQRHRDDPLLFIESIPITETRNYVQRVLTFSWIYANRLGLPSPSLDAIAGGQFPEFQGTEAVTAMLRARPQRGN